MTGSLEIICQVSIESPASVYSNLNQEQPRSTSISTAELEKQQSFSSQSQPLCTVIIGAGVIGLSLAYELALRGRRVKLIDQGQIGQGSSWAGAGILPAVATHSIVDPLEQLRSFSHELHSQWAQQLRSQTGIDTGFRRCGGLYVARSKTEAATLVANELWWREHGVISQRVYEKDISNLEPSLMPLVASGQVIAAWYLPDECQVRNPRHLKALALACLQMGVQLCPNWAGTELIIRSNQAAIRDSSGELIPAKQICICSGAWARLHLEQMQLRSGIMPIRGQMILYRLDKPLLQRIVNEGHRYLVPRDDGRILAGSSEEEVGYRVATTPEIIDQLHVWASGLCPALTRDKIEKTWAGLRPGSFDGLPYLGSVPGATNLFLAAGHFRAGLHLSCATAVMMADLMDGRKPDIDLDPFRVGRG